MREARNRFANLVKEAFAKAGRDPIDFASEFKTAERRECGRPRPRRRSGSARPQDTRWWSVHRRRRGSLNVKLPIPEHRKPAGPPLKMEEHIEEVQALLDWLNAHMDEHDAAVSRRGDLEIKKTFLERKLLDSYPEPLTEQERVIWRKALENVSAELSRTESIIGEFRESNRELGRYGLANIPFWLAEELVWMEMKKQKGGKE